MGRLQYNKLIDAVHKLSTQKKLILLATILHNKYNKSKYFFRRNKLKEIYVIYQELCHKIPVNKVNKKKFLSIVNELANIGFLIA